MPGAFDDVDARGAAGHEWFPAEPTGEYVRLVFAGPSPGRFIEAARVLGEATQ